MIFQQLLSFSLCQENFCSDKIFLGSVYVNSQNRRSVVEGVAILEAPSAPGSPREHGRNPSWSTFHVLWTLVLPNADAPQSSKVAFETV